NLPLGLKIAPFGTTYSGLSAGLLTFLSAINTTSIDITLDASVPQKGEDFVNHLIELYIQSHINASNSVADSTITFINDRISRVARELSNVEGNIETFKKTGNLTDIQEQSRALIGEKSDVV